MFNSNEALYLIQGLQFKDPKLYDCLTKVVTHLGLVEAQLNAAIFNNVIQANAGIEFPNVQVPSSDPNTLDDYEEGTWIPTIGGAGGTTGQTYGTLRNGRYVKVGKLVFAHFSVALTAKGTITGAVQIQGLPFKSCAVANSYSVGHIGFFSNMATNWLALSGFIGLGLNYLNLYGTQAAVATVVGLATADIANNTWLIGQCIYESAD